jgi:hypothetical protein
MAARPAHRSASQCYRNPSQVSTIFLNRPTSPRPVSYCLSIANDIIIVSDERDGDSDENSSLMSGPGDILPDDDAMSTKTNRSHCLDVTGLALLYKIEFWQLWILMGLLTGVGLMTIK